MSELRLLTPIQETIFMFQKTVNEVWDNISPIEQKIFLNSYIEMLKEDSGLNELMK